MGQQNAGHHRLQVIWGYIPTTLLPQDIKHAPYRVHLDSNNNTAPVNRFLTAVGVLLSLNVQKQSRHCAVDVAGGEMVSIAEKHALSRYPAVLQCVIILLSSVQKARFGL